MHRLLLWQWVVAIVAIALVVPPVAGSAGAASSTSSHEVTRIEPLSGEVVGVAHPVVVAFRAPVANRAAAERSIRITASQNMIGTFTWASPTTVEWIPTGFWPAHAEVTVLVGGAKSTFHTGAAVVGIADIDGHTFTVSVDDQVVRAMPASMGKPGFETPVGMFDVLEKQRSVVFDSRTIGFHWMTRRAT